MMPTWLIKLQLSAEVRVDFYDQLYNSLSDGKSIDVVVNNMLRRSQQRKDTVKIPLLEDMRRALKNGQSATSGMFKWFPRGEVMLLAAAETQGALIDGLAQASDAATTVAVVTSEVRALSRSLGGFLLLILGIMYGFYSKMGPLLENQLPATEWPLWAYRLHLFTYALFNYWPITIVLIAGVIGAYKWALPNWTSPLRKTVAKIPLIGKPFELYQLMQTALFMKSLSGLLTLGTPIETCLLELDKRTTPWTHQNYTLMLRKLKKGDDPDVALSTGYLDRETEWAIQDAAGTTAFAVTMQKLGDRSKKSVLKKVAKITVTFLLIGKIAVACSIGWVYVSFMQTQQVAKEVMESKAR